MIQSRCRHPSLPAIGVGVVGVAQHQKITKGKENENQIFIGVDRHIAGNPSIC